MSNSSINKDLLKSSYFYELPEELIAQRPMEPRDHSRLLIYDEANDQIIHAKFKDLPKYLPERSSLVVNNSKVFPCRLKAKKSTGGKVELFFLSLKPLPSSGHPCLIKSSGKKKVGDQFVIEGPSGDVHAEIIGLLMDGTFEVKVSAPLESLLESKGQVPIPPYIRQGESDEADLNDYQTIYASNKDEEVGSVAAPTAGLHFTPRVFEELNHRGITKNEVTLHVGLGTFRPVKAESILDHQMHEENFWVSPENWKSIKEARCRIAVGTTSLRVLESLWAEKDHYQGGEIKSTSIFLHPGVEVHSIDALITNFHLPESTLLMLVSALIGREKTLELYRLAVKERYRFFSYGDAMLILRGPKADR